MAVVPYTRQAFSDMNTAINNLQLATATLSFLNMKTNTRQVYQVPAGQGKSKIHAALTFSILINTKENVFVVFQNEGLLNDDLARNQTLLQYMKARGIDTDKRLKYLVGIKNLGKPKQGVVIFDESDDIMFDDMEEYYAQTQWKNLKVVCLTATAYDGEEFGSELKALNLLDYKTYSSEPAEAFEMPQINESMSIKTVDKYKDLIK